MSFSGISGDLSGIGSGGSSGTPASSVPCFLEGTKINITPDISASIERLYPGQFIHTESGEKCIRWIAKKFISYEELIFFEECLPVRFNISSLGDNVPSEPLLVSANHFIMVDGQLVTANSLINNQTIKRDSLKNYKHGLHYYHIEFDTEEIIHSQGVRSSSFLEWANTFIFDNLDERPSSLKKFKAEQIKNELQNIFK